MAKGFQASNRLGISQSASFRDGECLSIGNEKCRPERLQGPQKTVTQPLKTDSDKSLRIAMWTFLWDRYTAGFPNRS